ncbi:MAG: type sorting protein [Mucilaginibacter sp.]|nr:type sorting protein [Mucilaginibacter sp.]
MLKILLRFLSILLLVLLLPFIGNCQISVPKWVDDIGGSGSSSSIPSSVKVDKQNNIYITGFYNGTVDFDPSAGVYNLTSVGGSIDTYVAKYTSAGALVWAVSIGGTGTEQVNDMTLDANGSPTITGQYDSPVLDADPGAGTFNLNNNGGNDGFLIKLDTNGKFVFANSIGGSQTDYGDRVSSDKSGNIIWVLKYQSTVTIGGQSYTSQGSFNGLIIKYDALGNLLWVVNLGDTNDSEARAVTVDSAGNIIVSGNFSGNDNFNPLGAAYNLNGNGSAIFLAKYNPSGILIWATSVSGTAVNNNIYLCVDSSDDIFLDAPFSSQLGFNSNATTLNPVGSQDLFLAKYKPDGTYQWVKDIGGSSATIYNYGIVSSTDDNIYISGYFSGTVDFDPSATAAAPVSDHGQRDLFFAKYDSDGNYKWAFSAGNASCNNTLGRNLAVDSNNDILLVGSFCSTVHFDASKCTSYNLTSQSNIRDSFLAKYIQSTPTAASQITAFSVAQQVSSAIIDQAKLQITVTVPAGTDVSVLKPAITVSVGVTLTPASGTAQNFTSPVTYTLGTTCASLNYTVNVVFAPSSSTIPPSNAQVCATSGEDGPTNVTGSINSYFPALGNITLAAGQQTIALAAVPPTDPNGNNFGTTPISAGDLLLIIQMQDATINFSNSNLYGANNAGSGLDGLGATGYTNIGNSGKFEYVIATNNVPLTGGVLTFKGSGTGNGAVYSYINADPTASSGKKAFQIIRIPQYSNLRLSSNISPPPFNGKAGGIITFQVAGNMDFNGFTVDVSARGFRGGYSLVKNSVSNVSDLYVAPAADPRVSGKGEGIAGTPRYMWDGYNEVDNLVEGLPGGSGGRGAPANAGGGGNDSNSGGAGGGNGGQGGVGGLGYQPIGGSTLPNGGRPGLNLPPDNTRLILGGGGGGGHANDALTGVKGGVGGGVVIINAGSISGNGTISANGGAGQPGVYGGHPDGSGGGGAGGTVFIKVSNPNPAAVLIVNANGGNGGNTEGDPGGGGVQPHGPGGGGGGGTVFYAISSGSVTVNINAGKSGLTNSGAGTSHFATDGQPGIKQSITIAGLPPYLQGTGSSCFPQLVTTMRILTPGVPLKPGDTATYVVKIVNISAGGNAGGVQADCAFPQGFAFKDATVTYGGTSGGPAALVNKGTANKPLFGDFNIPQGDSITINLTVTIACIASGTYNSSAEALYLDPTRDYTTDTRRITAKTNAFAGSNTTYQDGSGSVPGSNFDGTLSNADDVNVVNAIFASNTATAPAITTFCTSGDPAPINGSTPTGGNGTYSYQWQSSTDNTNFTDIAGATAKDYDPPLLNVSIYYRRTVISGACATPLISNVITITITPAPATPVPTAANVSVCSGSSATLSVASPRQGITYDWYDSPSKINHLFTGPSYVINPATASATYYVGATSGACASTSLASVTLTVNSVPANPLIANNLVAMCSGSSVTLNISNPQPGFTYNWYTASAGGGAVSNSANFSTPALSANTVYYAEAVNSSGCASPGRTQASVTVNPAPNVTAQNNSVCSGSSATLTASTSDNNAVINWYASATGGSVLYTGSNFTTPALNSTTNYYAEAVDNSSGCASAARTVAAVQILQPLATPVVSVSSTSATSVTFQWNAVPGATGYQVSVDNGQTFIDPSSGSSGLTNMVSGLHTDQAVTILVKALGPCQPSANSAAVTGSAVPLGNIIYVPNAFTPNGDGINDLVRVHSESIKSFRFFVYDQWGELLFTSTDQQKGWDGTYKGTNEPAGVYVYYLQAMMIDGQTVNKKGTITLLR